MLVRGRGRMQLLLVVMIKKTCVTGFPVKVKMR